MKGLIVKHLGREVKVGAPNGQTSAIAHIMYNPISNDHVFHLQVDVLDGESFIHSFQLANEGMGVEMEVAEFDEASGAINEENHLGTCQIDPEYIRISNERTSEAWQLQAKLKRFRKLEAILKEEGLI